MNNQRGPIRQKFLQQQITKEILHDLYVNQKLSANHIATKNFKHLEITASTIITLLKQYNISPRTTSESAKLDTVRQQYQKTCKKRYGVLNVSSSPVVKNKRTNTIIQRYGVHNVFQHDDIKQKIRHTLLEKYGAENLIHTDYYWNRQKLSFSISKPHKKLERKLKKGGLQILNEKRGLFSSYNDVLERNYSPRPDMVVKNKKVVIEVYGDYFHANPKLYKSDAIIQTWRGPKKASDIWLTDQIRTQHIERHGYKVYVIWESDIDNDELIQKMIYEITS